MTIVLHNKPGRFESGRRLGEITMRMGICGFALLLAFAGFVAGGEPETATSGEAAIVSPDPNATVDGFVARLQGDPTLDPESRRRVIEAVTLAQGNAATSDEAVTAGLKLRYPAFAEGVQAVANEQAAAAVDALTTLSQSDDPFLATESQLFLARAFLLQGRAEEALPLLKAITSEELAMTPRIPEAWFLRARSEAAMLDGNAAASDLRTLLRDYPAARPRMRREAQAMLIDINEAQSNLLLEIQNKMDYSGRRLGLEDSGTRTQEVQGDVVALLTEMIDELEKKSGQCKGCKCAGGGSGRGGATPGMSSGTSEPSQITERNGPRTPWVDLGQRYEDPSAFSASKTRVPLQYRELVEQYYRSFQDTSARE